MEFSFQMPGLAEINQLVQQQGFAPAPTPIAPPPAPLPSVEPAPMPAPVAPLPTPIPSFVPDPMNIPGLPQLPMPAPVPPVAQPAPAPAPVPLPQVEPMPPVKPLPTTPPIMELPNVPPVPVTPPPMVEPVPTPVPAPTPITPPPTPPTPVAPPPMLEPAPMPMPAPVPTPVAPPPVVEPAPMPVPAPTPDPTPVAPEFTLPPELLNNLPPMVAPPVVAPTPTPAPTPVAPPPAVEPAPTPVAPEFTIPPELLESLPPMVRPPEPAVGIETLAPEDFTAPAGIAAGPMSTPAVNNRVEAMEANIPLPSGGQFNLNQMEFDTESIPEVDPQIVQNALADAGLLSASTFTPNLEAGLTLGDTVLTDSADIKLPEGLGDTMYAGGTPDFDESTGQYTSPDTTTDTTTGTGGFNLTQEQQDAIDQFIADGGFNVGGGDVGFNPVGDTGTTGPAAPTGLGSATPTSSTTYQVGDMYFDNIADARQFAFDTYGTIDGVRAYQPNRDPATGADTGADTGGTTGSDALTGPYAGMEFYQNMTPEQRQAFDDFIASGGIANIPGGTIDLSAIGGGTINIPGYGGYTGTTPRPVVEAVQNLGVNRDPSRAGNVSAATQFGLSGATQAPSQGNNPFERPETQQGIGSLAGGG
jgi:hypothetical protein